MNANITASSAAIKTKNGRLSRSQSHGTNHHSSITTGGSVGPRRSSRGKHRSVSNCSVFSTALLAGPAVKMFRVLVEPPPAGVFFSGSEIRGCVQVTTEEEKKFKYIHVSLTGRAQVRDLADSYIYLQNMWNILIIWNEKLARFHLVAAGLANLQRHLLSLHYNLLTAKFSL